MTIQTQKAKLRKRMLQQRAQLSSTKKKQYDYNICTSLWQLIEDKSFKNIHSYLPMRSEIDLYPLIQKLLDLKLNVITSKTLPNRQLQHLRLTNLDDLEFGMYGTLYPKNNQVFEGKYDLIIVPGLAYDKANYRLGYGGGYYDSFLTKHRYAYQVGICYPFQLLDSIPTDSHDSQLNKILYINAMPKFN